MSPPLIVVAGPTASGKTTLAISLAKRLNGALISADSRMVYRGLDIGTGKPTWEYRTLDHSPWVVARASQFGPVYAVDSIDHYGLDLAEPETRFSLTDWLAFVRPLIIKLQAAGVQPIVVGGTGLYLKALVNCFEPPPTDPILRAQIEARTDDELFDTIYELDPVSATRAKGNRRRLVRALEVVELTSRPISDPQNGPPLEAIVVAPKLDRVELYDRIDRRLHERFKCGIIEEVRGLIDAGISPSWLRSLGLEYRFITDFLTTHPLVQTWSVEPSLMELEERLAAAIHAYARRQLTYLRHQLPVHWVSSPEEAFAVTQD